MDSQGVTKIVGTGRSTEGGKRMLEGVRDAWLVVRRCCRAVAVKEELHAGGCSGWDSREGRFAIEGREALSQN